MIEIKNRYTGEVLLTLKTLTRANLTRANLTSADLTDADLTRANLTGANLAEANLTEANLAEANLAEANLAEANLRGADLTRADLTGADLDFASWPLWCGSLNAILDDRLKAQLLYHVISVVDVDKFTQEQLDFANTFHRVGECPKLEVTK